MGVLRSTRGEKPLHKILAERTQLENLDSSQSNFATSNAASEQTVKADGAPSTSARGKKSSSQSDHAWRRQPPEFPKLLQVARSQDSNNPGRPQSSNAKGPPGKSGEATIKVQEGPHSPTLPSGAGAQGPPREFDGKDNAASNFNDNGQNSNQGQGTNGDQDSNQRQTQNQGKGFSNQAVGPRPNQKADTQDSSPNSNQNQNQGSNFDQTGSPRPNQNVGGQNSGQNQGNNGNGNQGQNQGKDGKGDQSPKPKQNENGNQNSDKPTETRPPKQTTTTDPTTSTSASSSSIQTTEPQPQPTEAPPPALPPSPSPSPPSSSSSSAQTLQQPPQPPAITPSVTASSTLLGVPATTSVLSSAETLVPTSLPPTSIAIGQPVAALQPTTSQTASIVAQGSSQSAASSPGLSLGATVGIAVGSVSALALVAALVVLFLKLRRRGALPHFKKGWNSHGDMTDDSGTEKRVSQTQLSASLIEAAATMGGTLAERADGEHANDRDEEAPRRHRVQQPPSVAQRLSRYRPWSSNQGRAISRRFDHEDQLRMSTVSNPFNLQDEVLPTVPTVPSIPNFSLRGPQPDLVQQPEPAASKDCPFQRLQDKMRLHNSSDPRPPRLMSKQTAVDRGSVSTVSSSNTYPSPHTSSRFSFGLLLQPSLDLFKFSDIRASLGGRGSGWSLWFKQDDALNVKSSSRDGATK